MRDVLEQLSGGHQFYHARTDEYASSDNINFRVSPDPLLIEPAQAEALTRAGQELASYLAATQDLYESDETAAALLDRGKPERFLRETEPDYLFFRPDMIITSEGLAVCEIETSPFGLGLSELLNRAYASAGHETMAEPEALKMHVHSRTSPDGKILFSDKTKAFSGQLEFLAETVFGGDDRDWSAENASEANTDGDIYRAHYLVEYLSDFAVRDLYDSLDDKQSITPSLTPQFEEKAILALIWDKRFEDFYRKALGNSSHDFLRTIIPPTWIVGEESGFALGLPNNYEDSVELAKLSRRQRQYVLKVSGFSQDSAWAEGVRFLSSTSQADAAAALAESKAKTDQLYIVQAFHEGAKLPMRYETPDGSASMAARVRLTPYFDTKTGDLLTIKATGCENTHRIHASSTSINTAVGVK